MLGLDGLQCEWFVCAGMDDSGFLEAEDAVLQDDEKSPPAEKRFCFPPAEK